MTQASTDELKQIDADIELLQLERKKAIARWLADNCPFKEGDEVTVCGYSHKGKRMRIVRLSVKRDWYDKHYQWVVKGAVLKADGKPGVQTAEFDQGQYEETK